MLVGDPVLVTPEMCAEWQTWRPSAILYLFILGIWFEKCSSFSCTLSPCDFWIPVMMTAIDLQDEGTFQMKQPARDLLKRLGSKRAQVIGWRDTWAMVTQKGAKVFGESYSKSTDFNTWGAPVVLQTEVPLITIEGRMTLVYFSSKTEQTFDITMLRICVCQVSFWNKRKIFKDFGVNAVSFDASSSLY